MLQIAQLLQGQKLHADEHSEQLRLAQSDTELPLGLAQWAVHVRLGVNISLQV